MDREESVDSPTLLQGSAELQVNASAGELLERPLHPKIRALTMHWISISPAGQLPGRRHLEPLDIPRLLPNIWLLDVVRVPETRLRYRLVGTNVARAFEGDPTGRFLDELRPGPRNPHLDANLRAVADQALPSWRVGRPLLWNLHDFLRLERVCLPLASDGVQVDMILALTVFLDRFGTEF